MIGSTLLLALQAVPSAEQPLAEEGYEHTWVEIESRVNREEAEQHDVWIDATWSEKFTYDGVVYPVALLRAQVVGPKTYSLIDLRMAITCADNTAASFASEKYLESGEIERSRKAKTITFNPIGNSRHSGFAKIFNVTCARAEPE